MTKVQAVFFDLFETLITEYAGGVRKVRRAADPERRSRIGLTEREFRQEWNARIGRRMTGAFPDYPAVLREICTHRGLAYTEETLQRMLEERGAEKSAAWYVPEAMAAHIQGYERLKEPAKLLDWTT
ncbi:hypothetical protein [Paenibacillus mucilaginosus]|uniref:HAD-superfamily hydrolase, subfamily IA, variant 1 n=1 Tax=Paenibacillus mucilaginosus (strain KNP414) TaxID=1036673 RepID=F8FG88_PAEMK|nr:hypothetical protein [Paenibacillus mucilaginosus]AEI43908.1 HAD-superfamily hydrolase, subfamily IA, variant 1 [Paenibacillus mucilaginosus KNP414]MCG7212588.1 HAD family hydrolase [Paenibacillus mucilaginosus]WDM25385.1 HAD family hydrolase [Paenibacillus mucilaginosus]